MSKWRRIVTVRFSLFSSAPYALKATKENNKSPTFKKTKK
jgi:hypothetical protein